MKGERIGRRRVFAALLWLCSLLWLILALSLSSQTGEETGELSRRIAEVLGRILSIPEASMEAFHNALRTLAHVAVYFILAALVCGATLATFPHHRAAWLWAVAICIVISIVDEYRKVFIPGRHCTWSEAGLNVLGCILGAVTAWTVQYVITRSKRRKPI